MTWLLCHGVCIKLHHPRNTKSLTQCWLDDGSAKVTQHWTSIGSISWVYWDVLCRAAPILLQHSLIVSFDFPICNCISIDIMNAKHVVRKYKSKLIGGYLLQVYVKDLTSKQRQTNVIYIHHSTRLAICCIFAVIVSTRLKKRVSSDVRLMFVQRSFRASKMLKWNSMNRSLGHFCAHTG